MVAGHGVCQGKVGEMVVTQQARLPQSQLQYLAHQRPVIVGAFVFAARAPGLPDVLAQIAPLRKHHEGRDGGARQRNDMRIGARDAALGGRLARRRDDKSR